MNETNTLDPGRAKVQDASTEIQPRTERLYVVMMTGKGDSRWTQYS